MNKKLYQYTGAFHIHTTFSDGTGDIETISKAAKKAGLDWIIITDHNSLDVEEGFYNDICVIKGEELSPHNNANHCIALGIDEYISPEESAKININHINTKGGFSISAHPFESINRQNNAKPIRWTDKTAIPDCVEIWNWFSQWADNYNDSNIFQIIFSYLLKKNLVTKPTEETLTWWSEINNNKDILVPAIGGIDAHALKIKKYIIPVTIFPYEFMFKTINNVITTPIPLSDDFQIRKKEILSKIKLGKLFIINRSVINSIPEIIQIDDDKLYVKLQKPCDIHLLRDGELLEEIKTKEHVFEAQEHGLYRLEILYKNKGYIYTNNYMM